MNLSPKWIHKSKWETKNRLDHSPKSFSLNLNSLSLNLEFWHFGQGFSYLAAYEVEIESWIESGFGELGWRLCLSLIWCSNLGFAIWSLYGIVHFLGLLLMFWVCCSAQWVCCLISLWHISFYGFVSHSDLLIIIVDLLYDLLWHSSFSRFSVHLVHFPFFLTN